MSINQFRGVVEWVLMVALVFGAGAIAQAQDEDADNGGPVIQIGKGDAENPEHPLQPGATDGAIIDSPAAPAYWIGLVGGPIGPEHPLRSHVEIPEDQGLLVASVVPDGPAAKAGLKRNDILLRANDTDLREMQDLVDLVLTEGEKKGQITVEVLRRGQRETVYITPEERPADARLPRGNFGRAFEPGFGVPGGAEIPQELLREFGNMPFDFRNLGPGVIVGGGGGAANLPNGVSVSIAKENDQPARITVRRGGETWEIVGDDPESLKQLPDDLRPFVEQMLHGGARRMQLPRPGEGMLPELGDGRLRERLERMEERMQELQERLMGPESKPANAPAEPQDGAAQTK
jgi:membrane-associated protease RseP (regulator of RpoE activity)